MKGCHHARLEVGALDFISEEETGKKVKKISQGHRAFGPRGAADTGASYAGALATAWRC